MRMNHVRRPALFGAALLLAAAITGCSDSSTTPKATDPYPNAQLLVSGAAVEAGLPAADLVIVDTRSAPAYAAGHIPGAINLPVSPGNALFDKGGAGPDATDLKSPAELAAVLGAAGIAENSTIVLCGADVDWLVGRMFWMLEYLGATDVRLLDGGYAKWTADARATTVTPATGTPRTFTPSVVASRSVGKEQVLAATLDPDRYAIVDARNTADYLVARIPHAVNILVGDFLNPDFTMKSSLEIETLLADKGIDPGQVVYTHCYVGYRSSQEYFVFRLMGYTVAQYDGSWTEWAADPNTPKES